MRTRVKRHLGGLLEADHRNQPAVQAVLPATPAEADLLILPMGFTGHQYAVLLLHIAAEIEHGLMVAYLYAGFSIGGAQVPQEQRAQVARWRDTILGIAKEEMGHLITVQNVLRCIGGPLNLDREDYPWDSNLYPFPFELEPLTLKSLAKYVYAEAPDKSVWTGPEADAIRALALTDTNGQDIHRVGLLFDTLQKLFTDETLLKNSDFRADTYPYQANWDEWGRGYQGGKHSTVGDETKVDGPDVLVLPVSSRSDCLAALNAVATQGEATEDAADNQPSHFNRFLGIYREYAALTGVEPSRNVPVNPAVGYDVGGDDATAPGTTRIVNLEGQMLGHLFNLRYQLLLVSLLHTFEYPSNVTAVSQVTPRGLLIHSTFGEMYNLRALSELLMQTPMAFPADERMAGPPFQPPFSLQMPVDPIDRWRLHLDLLEASADLAEGLIVLDQARLQDYMNGLMKVDAQTMSMIAAIRGGGAMAMPASPMLAHR